MAILIIMPDRDSGALVQHLEQLDPRLDVRIWPDQGNPDDILCALTWNHPYGVLQRYKNLSLIHSYGAGVDHLLADSDLPDDTPICRVIDPGLAEQMNQYLLCTILNYRFDMQRYWQQQQQGKWQGIDRHPGNSVGILGLGQLGQAIAQALTNNGFEVHGWSRNKKKLEGVTSHIGDSGLKALAQKVDYLICLLPLTAETTGILNQDLFKQMQPHSYLINVGRGGHLVEVDLIDALNNGQIAGACLDVTTEEPLPATHLLWQTNNITITPHISSLSNPQAVAEQLLDNYRRRLSGTPLKNLVDRKKGY